MWALSLYLLELSLGRTVDDDAVLVRGELSGLVDENGRPLAPRLSDVLSAMLAPTPESRLLGFLPVRRVCAKAAAAFGGAVAGQKGLKQAAVEAMTKPLKATKDLPARAILGSADLRRLRGSTPTVIMPVRATPLPGSVLANAPSSPWPPLKDVAGVVAATPAAHSAGYGVQPGDSDGGPIDSALNGDAAAAASAEGGASDDAGTTDADADDLAAAGLASTSRRRGPLLVVAVVVVALVVVAIAVVATR